MKVSLGTIAALLQAETVGDLNKEISNISKIEEAGPGCISFLANMKYKKYLYESQASAIIVAKDFVPEGEVVPTLLKVEDPYSAFSKLLEETQKALVAGKNGIEEPSFVHESASLAEGIYLGAFSYIGAGVKIGKNTKIFPGVYIGDYVEIGENTLIYPQAVIYPQSKIGNNCILHAGCRIGSDGFGFAPQEDGSFKKIQHIGNVVLEDEVEIGSNTCIDRGTTGSTRIGKGVKLDNLIQVAHNVEINSHTVIAAQSGISGSTKIGPHSMIGGQVGIVGHLEIAARTKIDAQSGVNRSIKEEGQAFRGSPIQPFRNQLRSEALFRRLREMSDRIETLEKELKNRL
ncbi:MAG: UDP-3-O-(3-hydroxymyristoyl)glucosamine N-acyltransferase [Bacteroidota bacterium]